MNKENYYNTNRYMLRLSLLTLLNLFLVVNIQAQIGINTTSPAATLHIVPEDNEDPLIISNLLSVDDPANPIEGDESASYLNLKISKNGVVRRESPAPPRKSKIVDLAEPITIESGSANGNGGNVMKWVQDDDTHNEFIALPEDGAYIFSFRLYGKVSEINTGTSFYVSSWKEGEKSPFDIAEIYVAAIGKSSTGTVATYSINLTASGKAGDKVYFKIAYYDSITMGKIGWTLSSTPGNKANKTSLLYWKA